MQSSTFYKANLLLKEVITSIKTANIIDIAVC